MTRAEFQALFPEFAATTYNARIDALLPVVHDLDADKAGSRLNFILGLWLADYLTMQDIAITYGSAASLSSSSTSTEKRVGDVSIKRGISSSAGGSSGGGGSKPGQTSYGVRYDAEVEALGFGVLVS